MCCSSPDQGIMMLCKQIVRHIATQGYQMETFLHWKSSEKTKDQLIKTLRIQIMVLIATLGFEVLTFFISKYYKKATMGFSSPGQLIKILCMQTVVHIATLGFEVLTFFHSKCSEKTTDQLIKTLCVHIMVHIATLGFEVWTFFISKYYRKATMGFSSSGQLIKMLCKQTVIGLVGLEVVPFFISKYYKITAEEFSQMVSSFFISKFKKFKEENEMEKADDNPILILGFTLPLFFIFVLNKWLRYGVKVSRPHVKVFQDPLSIKTAVSESVRANIHLIESDLIVSESNLIDELQINGYLSEDELKSLKKRNRTDQAHIFAQRLEVMDDESFIEVVQILEKCCFGHIASALTSSYNVAKCEVKLQSETQHLFCPICRLKRDVDIKELRSDLKKEDLLPSKLYRDINELLALKGHQDELWKELFYHFKSCGQRSVETRFLKMLNTPKHRGLYKCFQRNFPTHFKCGCNTPYLFRALPFHYVYVYYILLYVVLYIIFYLLMICSIYLLFTK